MIGIGFDSGGSHTSFALCSGEGPVWPEANECADSISNARGDKSVRAAISWITRVITMQPHEEICAWIGAAGFSAAGSSTFRELFEPMVQELRQSGKHCEVFLANDGVSILKSPPLLGQGLAAIVGTGSVVMGVHPMCPDGVIKRGGFEWLVSDEGAGVWMTLECIRLLLRDIQTQGALDYHSPLLDRLCDYFQVTSDFLDEVPPSHRALARAEMLARVVSEGRADAKRRIAGFVYPHLFDLATLASGRTHDRIAAQVIKSSVDLIVDHVNEVSEILAAYTADSPNARERLKLLVAGNIAANPAYGQQFVTAVSACKYIDEVSLLGDAAGTYAELAWHYLEANGREQRTLARYFDPLHPVLKLL